MLAFRDIYHTNQHAYRDMRHFLLLNNDSESDKNQHKNMIFEEEIYLLYCTFVVPRRVSYRSSTSLLCFLVEKSNLSYRDTKIKVCKK